MAAIPKYKYFLLATLFLFASFTRAEKQNSSSKPIKFDKKHWEELTKGRDYIEGEKKPKNYDSKNIKPFEFSPFSFDPLLGKIILFTVAIGLLIFILYKLAQNHLFTKKKTIEGLTIEDIENEHIDNLDLHKLLQKALELGNYKLALRIHYLIILKKLSDSKLIEWKKDKTNYDYMIELSQWKLVKEFSLLTHIFNTVWYSNVNVNNNSYDELKPHFTSLLKQLTPETIREK